MLEESDVARFIATIDRLPDPPASVLDVGCGTGILADTLATMGYSASGIDLDADAMAEMEQPHLVGSAADLPVADRTYDIVILNEVLEHLPTTVYERALAEASRVAAKAIVVTVPNGESLESASTRCRACGCVFSVHGHVRRFDPSGMTELFEGFSLTDLGSVGPFKLRHRTVEWILRRRLLGRWPAQPGATCPQCAFTEPGAVSPSRRAGSAVTRAVRHLYAAPWKRWWLVARYDRDTAG